MSRALKRLTALIAAGILCLPLSACSPKSESCEFFAMDTYMTISATGGEVEAALQTAQQAVFAMERRLSATDEKSEIAALNASGRGEVSADTAALLERALVLAEKSGGAFDPTVRPLMELWGFTTEAYRVPETEEIDAVLPLADWESVELSGTEVSLAPGQKLDLGGIAKGWASETVCAILREHDVESALLYLGGSVQTLGAKPDGSLWRVGVQNPDGSESHLGILSVGECAVVSSGGYQRYFEHDGHRYHHILDPETGFPADSGLASVTVVCGDAVAADAYSTALFVMGLEGAHRFWREHSEELDLVLYTEAGELYITEGLENSFSSTLPCEVLRK